MGTIFSWGNLKELGPNIFGPGKKMYFSIYQVMIMCMFWTTKWREWEVS